MANLTLSATHGLRNCTRYITTHDSTGKSILASPTELMYRSFAGGAVSRAYATTAVPVPIANDQDLKSYLSSNTDNNLASYALAGKQTTVPGGVNVTYFVLAPGAETTMHRTVSVDFTVVLEGEVTMELDGGERVLLKSGDSVVQRATMHKWINASSEKPARVIGVLCACEQIEVAGKKIEEEWL